VTISDETSSTLPLVHSLSRHFRKMSVHDGIGAGKCRRGHIATGWGPRSAIQWVTERYQGKVDTDGKARNGPDDWSREVRGPRTARIVTWSSETMTIVNALPALQFLPAHVNISRQAAPWPTGELDDQPNRCVRFSGRVLWSRLRRDRAGSVPGAGRLVRARSSGSSSEARCGLLK
jgi:hypothetical protein